MYCRYKESDLKCRDWVKQRFLDQKQQQKQKKREKYLECVFVEPWDQAKGF